MNIGIIDDLGSDIKDRYSELIEEHELYIAYIGNYFEMTVDFLKNRGFNEKQIFPDIDAFPGEMDIYFLDGLHGKCLDYLENRIPPKKSFVVTSDPEVQKDVKEKGYQLISEFDISTKVRELCP